MIPPAQIQLPPVGTTTVQQHLRTMRTRFTNWVTQVHQSFQSHVMRQVPLSLADSHSGTVPFTIEADTDGTARAHLIADGQSLLFTGAANPAAGEWTMTVGEGLTTVRLGSPATRAWFAFLVAR